MNERTSCVGNAFCAHTLPSFLDLPKMPPMLKRCATGDREVSPPPSKRKVTTSTTCSSCVVSALPKLLTRSAAKAVSNFFKPTSQKDPSKTTWTIVDNSLLRCSYGSQILPARNKPYPVAAFDLDSTLISTMSGKKFSKESHDWKWWHAAVEGKLQDLAKEG